MQCVRPPGTSPVQQRALYQDGNSSSENESDLIFGDEVSQPGTETTAEVTLNAKADALLDEWLDFRIDWAEVAKVEQDNVVAKLSVLDRKRNVRVWNVEQVCGSIDVCRWFAEVGQIKYPSITKLARV
ncbi:hypothetical protein PR003_g29523 [Phytophthora rubi]|uniref:HAT C-terminal dimerisation domain-containing protein n=1 Tax=Phytophthora rubi TaxID=129364 RepID=A0A6A4BJA9_9STRA|nr:hypothetical protein PR003_g29523 [Phytophthora rubi]